MHTDSELSQIEQIKQLKAKYYYYLDTKNWDGWKTDVFAIDAFFDVQEVRTAPFHGIDEFLEFVIPAMRDVKSVHHGHMPIIELTSETTATAIWAMEDVLFMPHRVHGYGHYHETYEFTPNGWRIKSMRLTRLYGPAPL